MRQHLTTLIVEKELPAMLFIDNKYTRIYNTIIERAKSRSLSCYTEKHHIIPRSLGGSDNDENLVSLTAREHLICHLLLTKITQGQYREKMLYAVQSMTMKSRTTKHRCTKINSRIYESIKKELSTIRSSKMSGKTYEEQMGKDRAKRKKASISKAHSKENNPFWGKKHTAESRKLISENQRGEKSHKFKGYYITPWGKFASTREAARHCPVYVSPENVRRNCTTRRDKIINKKSIVNNNFLTDYHLGKTYADIGYGFEIST